MKINQLTTIDELIAQLPAQAPHSQQSLVKKAYHFAVAAHQEQRRESGELYIHHDLAVADIVNQMGIDCTTVAVALLHDVLLEHTGKTLEDIEMAFGRELADLVKGLEKFDPYVRLDWDTASRQMAMIHRAILTVIEDDLRTVLVRMADNLQDLRKANRLTPDQQRKVALEARNIYAPVANRLGIWQLKWELEDLSFRYLQPDEYKLIARHLSEKRTERDRSITNAIKRLQTELAQLQIPADVTGRPKHIYSIYRKMQRKKVGFEEIYDVRAIRVILNTDNKHMCYQVLGVVHNLWSPISQEFDDYIARSKNNGYQSLHTAVIDEQGRTLEVQIRTRQMHEEAEKGIAAHWAYKETGGKTNRQLNKRLQQLRNLLTLEGHNHHHKDAETPIELEDFRDRIYVFTPKGDPIDLPAGATPIDFAYYIHTEVGHRCRGAKVNGKMVKLDYKLQKGDRVEIMTVNRGGPNREWMKKSLGYTISARTRSRIRQWFRQQEREQNIQQGREVVERELKRLGLTDTYTLEDLAQALKEDDIDEFLAKVGFGDIQTAQIGGAIAATQQKLKPDDELRPLLAPQKKQKGLTVKGVGGLHTRMANCCNPLPPEDIIGYITRGRGITVHRRDCKQILSVKEIERLIDVEWGIEEESYPISIVLKGYNRPNLMNDITNTLRGRHINLRKVKSKINKNMVNLYLVVEICNLNQLDWVLTRLENLPNVITVQRQRW